VGWTDQDADRGATDQNDRLTVGQAAARLGITQDAVRSRIKRGTLASEHRGGRVYVLVGDQGATDQPDQQTDQAPLVEALRDEIAHLRRESERKDTIIMSLSQSNAELSRTIRAIEALEPAPPRPGTPTPAEANGGPQAAAQEPERVSWWRRIFGE
jgi:hypothetical protein